MKMKKGMVGRMAGDAKRNENNWKYMFEMFARDAKVKEARGIVERIYWY